MNMLLKLTENSYKFKMVSENEETQPFVDIIRHDNHISVSKGDRVLGEIHDVNVIKQINSLMEENHLSTVEGDTIYFILPNKWIDLYEPLVIDVSKTTLRGNQLFVEHDKNCYVFMTQTRNRQYSIFTDYKKYKILLSESSNQITVETMTGGQVNSGDLLILKIPKEKLIIRKDDSGLEKKPSKNPSFNEILTALSNTHAEFKFFQLWDKYNSIEEDQLKDLKNNTGDIKYAHFEVYDDGIGFIIKEFKKNEDRLLQWQKCKGQGIEAIVDKGKRTVFLGDILEVYENTIKVDCEEDDLLKKIPKNNGTLRLDFNRDNVRIKRRKRAFDTLVKGNSKLKCLNQIIAGEYSFPSYRIESSFNDFIHENMPPDEMQKKAIEGALNTPDIFLIQGPPGTGKTSVINKIIQQLLDKGKTVLVTSYQNIAVDHVVEKLVKQDVLAFRYSGSKEKSSTEISKSFAKQILKNLNSNLATKEYDEKRMLTNEVRKELVYIDITKKMLLNEVYERMKKINSIYKKLQIKDTVDTLLNSIIQNCEQELTTAKRGIREDASNQLQYIIDHFPKDYSELADVDKLMLLEEAQQLMETILIKNRTELLVNLLKEYSDMKMNWFDAFSDEGYTMKLKEKVVGFYEALSETTVGEKYISDSMLQELAYVKFKLNKLEEITLEDLKYRTLINWKIDLEENPHKFNEVFEKYAEVYSTTCQKSGSYEFVNIKSNTKSYTVYDYVIVDEAARANPLDLFIPLVKGSKIILVGDQKQLPHLIEDRIEKKMITDELILKSQYEKYIKESLFATLYNNVPESRKVMLDKQFRMNKEIGDAVSNLFYDGGLKSPGKIYNDTSIFTGKSLVVIDVKGREEKEKNLKEASAVLSILQELDTKDTADVGIITFYKAQAEYIAECIRRNINFENITYDVNTVDAFQGKEKDIIILSTVRTKGLGFTKDRNRLNVALSRAKKLLIIVTDTDNMAKDTMYGQLFEYCQKEEWEKCF